MPNRLDKIVTDLTKSLRTGSLSGKGAANWEIASFSPLDRGSP
jgi:hypothetical protein